MLRAFSEESYDSNTAIELMEAAFYRTAIRAIMVSELANPQDTFVRWLMDQTYDGSKTAARVEWFSKHVRDALKDFCVANHRQEPISEPPPPPPPIDPKWTQLADFEGVSGCEPPPAIRLKGGEVRETSKWNRILWEIAQFLAREGHLTPADCPIRAGRKAKNFLVHTQPQNTSGKSFHSYRSLSNGLYLETGFSARNTIDMSKFLLEKLGQDPSQVWLKTG